MVKLLETMAFSETIPGPLTILRPEFPHVPAAFCTKALVLYHCRTGSTPAGRAMSATISARSRPTPENELSRPLRIEKYGPDCMIRMPDRPHPPATMRASGELPAKAGNCHRPEVTNRCDRWKSERPRESYYSRYAMGMQLHLAGESLAKWMAWDLMRGIDMLLERPYIDPARIVMLGGVAGGGDPAALTAALDERIAVVIPFNFGEASPEAHYSQGPRLYGPEFADPGWGSWDTTRNLARSISGQFFPWFICASVAPRRFVYAFEIRWPHGVENEPAWARYSKVFSLCAAREHLAEVDGYGAFPGPGEFTSVGVNARKKIYPILHRWLQAAIPAHEYHNVRLYAELAALTPAVAVARQPQTASKIALKTAERRLTAARAKLAALGPKDRFLELRRTLQARLGDIEPRRDAAARLVWSREVEGHLVEAVGLETEIGRASCRETV